MLRSTLTADWLIDPANPAQNINIMFRSVLNSSCTLLVYSPSIYSNCSTCTCIYLVSCRTCCFLLAGLPLLLLLLFAFAASEEQDPDAVCFWWCPTRRRGRSRRRRAEQPVEIKGQERGWYGTSLVGSSAKNTPKRQRGGLSWRRIWRASHPFTNSFWPGYGHEVQTLLQILQKATLSMRYYCNGNNTDYRSGAGESTIIPMNKREKWKLLLSIHQTIF